MFMHMHMLVCIHVCVCVCTCAQLCVHMDVFVHMSVLVYMHVHVVIATGYKHRWHHYLGEQGSQTWGNYKALRVPPAAPWGSDRIL